MQARAPDEGPSDIEASASGIVRRPFTETSSIEGRHDPKLLLAVAKKYNIDSTKTLVATYNSTTDENERAVLLGWLRKYNERSAECRGPKVVLEYSELSKVTFRSTHDDGISKNLFHALCSCICQGKALESNFAISLRSALMHIDPTAYGGVPELMELAMKLLSSLTPKPKLTRKNFARLESTLLALHQTYFLLNKSNQGEIDEDAKLELRRGIALKEKEMEFSCNYYPVNFHFKALRQAVERLELRDVPSHYTQAIRYISYGLHGFLRALHCVKNLARCDIDPDAIQNAYRKGRAVIINMGVSKKPCFDSFQTLMEARIEASKNEMKLELFESRYSIAMENQRKMKKGEDLKALRFGIIQELSILAKEGPVEDTRKNAAIKLVDLTAKQSVDDGWVDDIDILIALLDVVYELHKTGQCVEAAEKVLKDLHDSCKSLAKEALMEWLDRNSMEDKLRARSPQKDVVEHIDLCIKIGRDVGYTPLDIMDSNREELKKRYLRDDLAMVTSLFEEGSPKHVKDMKHHVVISEEIIEERGFKSRDGTEEAVHRVEEMEGKPSDRGSDQAKEYYEKRTRVTKPIALDDLFKRRSLKPGEPESEIRRVLLYGNPGSGKTCITKVVAHKWALGELAQDINAVYVVPVRVLNSAKSRRRRLTRLEGVISKICFSGSKHAFDYEDLIVQVEHELDDPSTMLVIDGLDEANDHAIELLSTIWKRHCKVLLLSRPYNMRNVEMRVDIQVECLGFNDQYLRDCIKSELSEDDALRLIGSLEKSNAMWEMAHIPVTANILCSLSKEHGTAIEEQERKDSIFQVYDDMANYIWKRFKTKPIARNVKRSDLFDDLERIAFETLRKGLILIPPRLVTRYATSTDVARTFKESGLLLLVLEGQEYQFPHLTFQEYFTGRHIAQNLRKLGADKESREFQFFCKGKYNQKHALSLSFAMHAYAEGQSKFALQNLLSIVDEAPVEVLGMQHFFLKMRVLEVILEETEENDLEDLLNDEQAINLAESARQLLECTIDDVLIREIVVENFQQLYRVLEGFPQVLNDTIDEVKKMLVCADDLTWMDMAKITDVLKLARHSSEQSYKITQSVLQIVEDTDRWYNPKECIERLSSIAEKLPQHAGEVLSALTTLFRDEDSEMRWAAMTAIGRIVAEAPQHAGEVLPTLEKECGDEEGEYMRQTAMTAIGRIVAEAPQHAGKVLPTLAEGCGDEDSKVCRAAMEAIGLVVAAAPQHAGDVLPTLAKACVDKGSEVRRAAMLAIGNVVEAAPHHAGDVLPMLMDGCDDETFNPRREAIRAIGCVVGAAPQHAGEILPTFARGCVDEYSVVRNAARPSLKRIKPEKVVSLAMSTFPTYTSGILFFFVQHSFSLDPLSKLKTVPIISHTTISQEVGRWNKDDIDLYVGFLRQEFEEKFPRLLEHLWKNSLKALTHVFVSLNSPRRRRLISC